MTLVAALTIALFGVSMARLTPISATLAMRVAELAPLEKTGVLSLLFTAGSVLSMLASPLAGRLSDRTTLRMGRRRPWIIGGTALGLVSLGIMAWSPNAATLIVGWCLCQVAFSAASTAIPAVVMDKIPPAQRGSAFGLVMGLSPTAGAISGVYLARFLPSLPWMFLVPGIFAALGIAVLVATVTDSAIEEGKLAPLTFKELAEAYWINPVAHPDLGFALLSRVAFYFAVLSFTLYNVYFLTDHLGHDAAAIPRNIFLLVAAVSITSVAVSTPAGYLSDWLGRRKILTVLSGLVVSAALFSVAFATSFPIVLIHAAIIGAGLGVYSAVGMALFAEVLPRTEGAGKGIGIAYVGSTLPSCLLPAAGALLLATRGGGNFTLLFFVGGVAALLSAVTLLPIKGVR